ncbi:MAG: hypothetical protein IJT97_05920 [Bacteroidaceae bacterium]|nr:hypothetical protein [Bacteroidaceae bacterium]
MKQNKLIATLAAIALILLSACSSDTDLTQESVLTNAANSSDVIEVSTYLSNSVKDTRAGAYGAIDTEKLKEADYGFGVFAYYTKGQTYADFRTKDAKSKRYPNHMYNEQFIYNATVDKWVYADPKNTKYWPNEFAQGPLDDQNNDKANDPAQGSTARGNVSFFAYGPYAPETETTTTDTESGMQLQSVSTFDHDGTKSGIVGFSKNDFGGITGKKFSDPYLKFILPTKADKQVDLLWGTSGHNSANVVGTPNLGVSAKTLDYYSSTTNAGDPYFVNADLTKQSVNGVVSFIFKHALAKIGGSFNGPDTVDGSDEDGDTPTNGLMVILDIDKDGEEQGGSLQPYAGKPIESGSLSGNNKYNTKVTINEISLSSEKQLTPAGVTAIKNGQPFDYTSATYTADLANTGIFNLATGVWTDHTVTASATGERTHTILPSGASYNYSTDDSKKDAVLNKNIAEPTSFTTVADTKARFEELPIGVTTVAKNVYDKETQPFTFIPGTHPILKVSITYTVRTYDAGLADKYTEVTQKITKRLYILDEIELNKQYNILIHLGLTSIKFEATVSDWDAKNINADTTSPGDAGDGTSPVYTYDDEKELEHIYLPKNVK